MKYVYVIIMPQTQEVFAYGSRVQADSFVKQMEDFGIFGLRVRELTVIRQEVKPRKVRVCLAPAAREGA